MTIVRAWQNTDMYKMAPFVIITHYSQPSLLFQSKIIHTFCTFAQQNHIIVSKQIIPQPPAYQRTTFQQQWLPAKASS